MGEGTDTCMSFYSCRTHTLKIVNDKAERDYGDGIVDSWDALTVKIIRFCQVLSRLPLLSITPQKECSSRGIFIDESGWMMRTF